MDNILTKAPDVELDAGNLMARVELKRRFSDTELLTSLIQKAGREAVLDHKRNGVSVSTWHDGKVVIVQPEDI